MRQAVRSRRLVPSLVVALAFLAAPAAAGGVPQGEPTHPTDFFGHELGADRTLARWDRIVEYFQLLDRESDRVITVDLGESTDGHPFLLVLVSSPENLANRERLAEVSRRLADPRGLSEGEVESLIAEGKAVVAQSLGLHSSEVAGAQAAPEIAWEFASRTDAEAQRILDETVLLLLPCINPDGQIMITDWYRRTVDTEAEGAGLPFLYHRYAGHDNNRDGDYMNLVESRYIAEVLYCDWKPQAYVDHHQMGPYGARFYVPPYSEPIRPGADPLLWRELSWYGAHIAYKLAEAGVQGVLNAAQYPGWGHFGWHWITPFHNIAGMLTESASANLASPLYLHPDQLRAGARGWPEYERQSNIPDPWPGGWWRVRDIVEQQKLAAWALQDMAARNRETVLRNAYLKAVRQVERGAEGDPRAYVVPAAQHDSRTAAKLIDTLLLSDVEIQRATSDFRAGGRIYEAGSFIVPMAQPKRGLVLNLLGRTLYPDNEWTRSRDGSPLRPYDSATHTMAEFMGVHVDAVDVDLDAETVRVDGPVAPSGEVAPGAGRYLLDGRLNASFAAVNRLLDRGVSVRRSHADGDGLKAGDFVVDGGDPAVLQEVAAGLGVDFTAAPDAAADSLHEVERRRVGVFQRYLGGNMDEGWTRLVLEQFEFPYETVMDEDVLAGSLGDRFDVIVLPHDSTEALLGESERREPLPEEFAEYDSGFGEEGVAALKAFVEGGGTLVTIGESADFAIDELEVPVRNVLEGVPSTEFFCPGSTLRVRFDTAHPLAWGMPEEGLALFWESPAFEIVPTDHNEDHHRVVVFEERDILQSGWLVGEEHIADKAGVVDAALGEGRVVLIGIRAQHRAQTHGTYKLLFNALMR